MYNGFIIKRFSYPYNEYVMNALKGDPFRVSNLIYA